MYDSYKELAADLRIEVHEARSRLDESTAELVAERRKSADLRARLMFAEDRLRGEGLMVAPVLVDGGRSAECGKCGLELEFEWDWCPCCGAGLDWRFACDEGEDEEAYDRWRDDLPEREWERTHGRGDAA